MRFRGQLTRFRKTAVYRAYLHVAATVTAHTGQRIQALFYAGWHRHHLAIASSNGRKVIPEVMQY